jgi:ribosomal protein S16
MRRKKRSKKTCMMMQEQILEWEALGVGASRQVNSMFKATGRNAFGGSGSMKEAKMLGNFINHS